MNILKTRYLFRNAWRLAALLTVFFAAIGVRAQDDEQQQQVGRFLLIFETSPVMKKNLPALRQTLGDLFVNNLQSEMQKDDDLAIWTVDEKLHTDKYPLQNWTPNDAETSADSLNAFLGKQNFTRHANLEPIQPLLNRVVRHSDELTVLIFCDNKSQLSGTPYDSGVNEIITNATAKANGAPSSYIVVLRSYHGKYFGCSVNRSLPLKIPEFPKPPKPQTPPHVESTTITRAEPVPEIPLSTAPVPSAVPALIIVGDHASTNVSDLTNSMLKPATVVTPTAVSPAAPAPPPASAPLPVTTPQATNAAAPTVPDPSEPKVAAEPQSVNPTPISSPSAPAEPLTAAVSAPQTSSTPAALTVSGAAPVAPANPKAAPLSNPAVTVAMSTPTDIAYLWPLILGGGLLVAAAAALGTWFFMRAKQPQGSLITSSMQSDPRLPPAK